MKLVKTHKLIFVLSVVLIGHSRPTMQAQPMTLEACVEAAMLNNLQLSVVRNNLDLSELRQKEARSYFDPKAGLSADYKYFTNLPYQLLPLSVFNGPEGQYKEARFGVPHNLGINLQVTVPIYNPQIKTAIKAGAAGEDLVRLQIEKSEEQVIYEVAGLYYNAQILQHQILFADSNLINIARLMSAVQLLNEQGLAKGTDVEKTALQQAQTQLQRSQLEGKLAQVLNGLRLLMGMELSDSLEISRDIPSDLNTDFQIIASVDARILQVQNRLLANELEQLKQSEKPTVAAVANYGLSGFGYFQKPNSFFKFFPMGFVGAQATYPLWNRPTRFKIAQKEAEIMGNRLQSEQVQAQNEVQTANATIQKATALANIPFVQRQIDLAASVYRQTLLQQQQGTASIADVLLADNILREAQTSYLSTLIEFLKADLELKKASGSIKN